MDLELRAIGRAAQFGLTAIAAIALFSGAAQAATVTVVNDCDQTVWPGIYLSNASQPNGGGWSMASNTTTSFTIPDNANGRFWGRKDCNTGTSPYQCATGSCGGSGVECAGTTGTSGTSLFEFTLVPGGTDTWDVSYVDGYDFPIGVTWSNNSSACSGPTNLTSNPTCHADVLSSCPSSLQDIVNGTDVDCLSPCTATGNEQLCCASGTQYDTPAGCDEAGWPSQDQTFLNLIHSDCPGSYGYAFDDQTSTWGCPNGTNYTVTFCPNNVQPGGGSSGGGTTGGVPSNGVHTLTPASATGTALDDSYLSTTNGSPVQLFALSSSDTAEQWNFANVGGSNYNLAINVGPYCLDDNGGSSGTNVQLWSCSGDTNQKWTFNAVTGGYNVVNGAGLCLNDWEASGANFAPVKSYPCSSGDQASIWMLDYTPPTVSNGVHELTPACASGVALDDPYLNTANGSKVEIYQFNSTDTAEQWNFANVGGNNYNLAINVGPYCLDDNGGSSGTDVQLWSCSGDQNQQWTFNAVSGGFNVVNGAGLCLNDYGASSTNFAPVVSYPCSSGDKASIWVVH